MRFPLFSNSNETSSPTVLEIVDGLRHISSFGGLHVEDEIVKRRSSVALILRFPGLATTIKQSANNTSIKDSAQKSLDELFDYIESQYKQDTFDSVSVSQQKSLDSPSYSPLTKPESTRPPLSPPSFAEKWMPEVLFIKRVNRKSDRWSGHVALPGGKRDPEDESDKATADRETFEEVGLDLTKDAHFVGPLDQRLVRTSWGRITLMTLCPFVYVLNEEATLKSLRDSSAVSKPFGNDVTFLKLQPTEIDRAFWIQVAELYHPQYANAYESVFLGDRLKSHKSSYIPQFMMNLLARSNSFGKMLFGATDLVHPRNMVVSILDETDELANLETNHPELSTMAASADPTVLVSTSEEQESLISSIEIVNLEESYLRVSKEPGISEIVTTVNPPYKLWGLTYGIVVDLLESFKRNSVTQFFHYPILTAPDTRFFVWLLTYKYVRSQRQQFKNSSNTDVSRVNQTGAEKDSNNLINKSDDDSFERAWQKATTQPSTATKSRSSIASGSKYQEGQFDIAGKSLAGYFPYLSKAIYATLLFRSAVAVFLIVRLVKLILSKRR